MLKPKAVKYISLWKLFYGTKDGYEIPKSGLNFINNSKLDKNFFVMWIENFKDYYVRIDILEKLFKNY